MLSNTVLIFLFVAAHIAFLLITRASVGVQEKSDSEHEAALMDFYRP